MTKADRPRRSWARRPRPKLTVGLLLAVLVAYGSFVVLSYRLEERSRRAWIAQGGSLEALVRRYPSRPINSTARQVEAIAAGLGLRLVPNWSDRGPLPDEPSAAEWQSVRRVLGEYLAATVERAGPAIDPLPEPVAAYLEHHAAVLADLRDTLVGSGGARWERELEKGPEARLPNLLGQIGLHRVLAVDALAGIRAGDGERAMGDLEASWMLAAGLRDDPVLIEQMVSMAVLHFQASVLRRLPVAPAAWMERLEQAGDPRVLIDALRHEVASLSMIDPTRLTGELSFSERVFGALAAPYLRVSHADALARWQRALSALEVRASLCPPADQGSLDWQVAARPWWNRLEDSLQAGFSAAHRLLRVQLDLELTRHWLALERARRSEGHWPERLPLGADSAACPGARWQYRVSSEQGVELRLGRELDTPGRGLALPLRFQVGP